jgi:plasmid stabilization system protein ParE
MRIEYHDEAVDDIFKAIEHQRLQGPGLAERLQRDLVAAIAAIEDAPTRWAVWRRGPMRYYMLEAFQYAICYDFDPPDLIRVLIFRHHAQKPSYGMKRR